MNYLKRLIKKTIEKGEVQRLEERERRAVGAYNIASQYESRDEQIVNKTI